MVGVCSSCACMGLLSFTQSKGMQVRLIVNSNLAVSVNVNMYGCLSLYVGPVIH